MYSATLREHALNPRNRREMQSATLSGQATYARCGDRLTLYFLVEDGVVKDVSFTAQACGPVVAAASMATTVLIGKSVEEALELSSVQLHSTLGGMPAASKRHSLLLVLQCLHEALGHSQKL